MILKILSTLAALVLPASAAAATDITVGGEYAVAGTNFDGSPYGGTVTIVVGGDVPCRITWDTGGEGSFGFCMRDEDSLAAAYQIQGRVGLVVYHVQPDGKLVGHWSLADTPGVGSEILVPKKTNAN